MTLITTLAPYAVAYAFVSVCAGLVIGRLLRTMNSFDDTAEETHLAPPLRADVALQGGMLPT